MGTWSQFLLCSCPDVEVRRGSIPRGLADLISEHGGDAIDGWEDRAYDDNGDGIDEDGITTWGTILSSFCGVCKIWGYLDDECLGKWEQALSFVDGLQEEEGSAEPWVLFYCSDEKLVYSLKWRRSTRKVVVQSMCL